MSIKDNQIHSIKEKYAFSLVGLGGTFDHIHPGHARLLETAFNLGKHVAIALTTNELLIGKEDSEKIQTYQIRETNLRELIEKKLNVPRKRYDIIPLHDPFGPAITNEVLEAHVSSMETYKVSLEINKRRIKNKLNPLILIVVPMVLDQQGERYSSSSIRRKL